MNRQSVINKFIEKAGPLNPKPQFHYVQGLTKGWYGLTTKLNDVIQLWRKKANTSSEPSLTRVGLVLPNIHREVDGKSYDFDQSDILNCARMLQNVPFKDISVILVGDTLPIAFHRSNCDISILLAPQILDIPKTEPIQEQKKKFKGNPWAGREDYKWISQMPNCTFWLVEVANGDRFLKCRNCGNELVIQDWVNRKIRENHPECMCSCNTYDDFCGCQQRVRMMQYDRLWRQNQKRMFYIKRSHRDIA